MVPATQAPAMLSENMTTEEVAAFYRTSPATLRYWRHIGKGPRSYKVGRRVLYRRSDVIAHQAAALNGTAAA